MSYLRGLFRLRNKIGISETREKLRLFTFDVCFVAGLFPGILRDGKALLQFVPVGLFAVFRFSGNGDRF
jgi:hypothetical protein